jgi:hypothetical protein
VLVEAFLGVAKVARDTHKREVGHSAVALELCGKPCPANFGRG